MQSARGLHVAVLEHLIYLGGRYIYPNVASLLPLNSTENGDHGNLFLNLFYHLCRSASVDVVKRNRGNLDAQPFLVAIVTIKIDFDAMVSF